jgi:integrase
MANASRKAKRWSYSAGEWGVNRVRVFDRGSKGIYREFFETIPEAGDKRRRVRMALGHADRERAKVKADEVALAFRRQEPVRPAEPTLEMLIDMYEREVSARKGPEKRRHDASCAEMFKRFFGADRKVKTLTRLEWDRFIASRRLGIIAPAKAGKGREVGDRAIAYDLKYLLAVLNWATMVGDGTSGVLLGRNPLKGLPLPSEDNPQRPVITAEQYKALRKAAPKVGKIVEVLLVVTHESGHRIGSIRQLRWSDINLRRKRIEWRPENDKIGFGHTTPLTNAAVAVLRQWQRTQPAIGNAWVFPAPKDPSQPCSRHFVRDLWEQLAEAAKLPKGKRLGWHSLRRKFASELKATPLCDLAQLGGWKDVQTLLTCYITPDEATQRAALAQRKTLYARGLA